MMATVLRKVKLVNKNKSESASQNGTWETEEKEVRGRMSSGGETFVQCGRVCGLVNVCTGPADSVGNRRRRNRPRRRGNPHLTLLQSLQLRIDLWTNTTGHLFDRSFTRRFCHRKSENELYRSNSFRFEKFDKQEEDLAQQKMLEERHVVPRPPVLVIDETTIRCTEDAGPVCGCDEKYQLIKSYKPFTFGTVNPYNRRRLPDACLKTFWLNLKIGVEDMLFEKPFAMHEDDLPEGVPLPLGPLEGEDPMLVTQPKYTEDYLIEKVKRCSREHFQGCACRRKR